MLLISTLSRPENEEWVKMKEESVEGRGEAGRRERAATAAVGGRKNGAGGTMCSCELLWAHAQFLFPFPHCNHLARPRS